MVEVAWLPLLAGLSGPLMAQSLDLRQSTRAYATDQ